jgi:hypothetical protein
VRQSNVLLATGELLLGSRTEQLAHGKLVEGSPMFGTAVSSYTAGADGRTLHFSAPPEPGTQVSYRYRKCPYELISAPFAAFGLTDPDVIARASAPNGRVIYQVRELVQEILRRDGAYWGK